MEALRQRHDEMLREAELDRLTMALRASRKRTDVSPLTVITKGSRRGSWASCARSSPRKTLAMTVTARPDRGAKFLRPLRNRPRLVAHRRTVARTRRRGRLLMRRAARLVQKWAPAVACAREGKGSAEGTLDAQLPLEGQEHNFRPLIPRSVVGTAPPDPRRHPAGSTICNVRRPHNVRRTTWSEIRPRADL